MIVSLNGSLYSFPNEIFQKYVESITFETILKLPKYDPDLGHQYLPDRPGIYFLVDARYQQVCYVGRTKNLRDRWHSGTHHKNKIIEYSYLFFLQFAAKDFRYIKGIEKIHIARFSYFILNENYR